MNNFDRIDGQCGRRAWGLAFALTRNAADADDVMQQAFVVAWQRSEQVPVEPWPWFAAVVANCARNHRRSATRRRARESVMQGSDRTTGGIDQDSLEQRELRGLLLAALGDLPADEREAVAMCHIGGLTQQQASAATGVNLNTLKARVSRGLERLRTKLANRSNSIEHYLATLTLPIPAGGHEAALRRWRDGAPGGATGSAAGSGVSVGTLLGAACAIGIAIALVVAWSLVRDDNTPPAPVVASAFGSSTQLNDTAKTPVASPGPVPGSGQTSRPAAAVEPVLPPVGTPAESLPHALPEATPARPPDTLDPPGPGAIGSIRVRISYYATGEKYMQWTEQVTATGFILQGSFSAFHTNGMVSETGVYVDNRREGPWTRYHPSGAVSGRCEYVAGLLSGPFQTFYEDGASDARGSYRDSKRTGEWTFLHPNGQRKKIATFIEDKLDGIVTEFDDQGRQISQVRWKNGVKQVSAQEQE